MASDEEITAPAALDRWQRWKARLVAGYKKLEKRWPLNERLAARLRKSEAIEIVYPDNLSSAEAHERFLDFLKRQAKHERVWKRRNAVLAGFGAPLFFLPGPNIWFYYPAVRALSHYYAEAGCHRILSAGKARGPAPTIRFTPSAELAELQHVLETSEPRRLDKAKIAQIGQKLGLIGLLTLYQ